MKFKTAAIIGGIFILLSLIPSGILFYQNQKLKSQVAQYAGDLNIGYKALTKSLQRSETKLTENTADLTLFAKENGVSIKAIRNDLDSIGGRLEAVSSTEAKTSTVVHNYYPSDSNTPSDVDVPICENDGRPIDIHSYTKRVETRELHDSNGMRVADISFAAAEKNPWNSKIYGIRYKILNTIGRGPNDQIILHTELTSENPEVQPGQVFRIEGVESRLLQIPALPSEFDFWDPALYLIGQLGANVYGDISLLASISLGFSIWSYGDDWRFLGISAGYDATGNAFRASIIPVMYNIGSPIPLLSNLFLGLDIGINHRADVSVGLVIGTRL